MEEHIFSTDLAEKLVWFVGLKNTIFCAHTPKEGVYLKVYGTVETQKGTKIQFSTIQLLVPFPVKSVRYRREPYPYISAQLVVYGTVGFNKITPLDVELQHVQHLHGAGEMVQMTKSSSEAPLLFRTARCVRYRRIQ